MLFIVAMLNLYLKQIVLSSVKMERICCSSLETLVSADQGAYAFLCPASAPSPSRRFGPANEVKERLHCQALQRLSGLTKALTLFY